MKKQSLRVSKDNALVQASFRLSLTEMHIILYGIGLVNPLQPDFPLSYRIDIDRFALLFNRKHGQIYKEVKEAVVKRFWERDFSYIDEKGKTVVLRWLTKMVYEDKSGYVEIKFSEEIQPYLHNLKNTFTAYYLDQVARFKSIYSVRLYENALMVLNKNKTDKEKFPILLDEIKKQLELENKYNRFCDFKSRVLEKAKKEINLLSDLNFDYKVVKLGRAPHQIDFSVSRKQKTLEDKPQKTKISTSILEKAKALVLEARTGWDLYAIEEQFYAYINKAGFPNNIEAAFMGFVKKKVLNKA
jgi:plasmid replication initiation protein